MPCSLRSTHYAIELKDYTLKKRIIQKFVNSQKHPVEMVYKFGQNETVTVFFVEVELYDPKNDERKILKAKIFKTEEAREKYNDAVVEGKSAILAEKKDPNEVILSLGMILSNVEVTVTMETIEEISVEHDAFMKDQINLKVVIPSLNYSGKEVKNVKKNVTIDCMVAMNCEDSVINDVISISHPKTFVKERISRSKCLLKTREAVSYNKDIEINVLVAKFPLISAIYEQNEKMFTTMVSFIPNFKNITNVNTEIIILIDCSKSMNKGNRIKHARSAVINFLKGINMSYSIKINIVRFGSSIKMLYNNGPMKINNNVLKKAVKFINNSIADMNSTDILTPLKAVMKEKVSESYTRQIFLLTDGEDNRHGTEEIVKFVRNKSSLTRIFCFGIGNDINPVLLTQTARCTNGRCVFIKKDRDIEKLVLEQANFAIQPSFSKITVCFPKGSNAKSVIEHVQPCFNLQKLSLLYFSEKKPKLLVVSYLLEGKINNLMIKPVKVNNKLSILAARKLVLELENFGDGKRDDEIVKLGLKYNFLTQKTSYLVISENEEIKGRSLKEKFDFYDSMKIQKIKNVQKNFLNENKTESYDSENKKSTASNYDDPYYINMVNNLKNELELERKKHKETLKKSRYMMKIQMNIEKDLKKSEIRVLELQKKEEKIKIRFEHKMSKNLDLISELKEENKILRKKVKYSKVVQIPENKITFPSPEVLLGEGGSGKVIKVNYNSKSTALKVITLEFDPDKIQYKIFKEIETMLRVKHPLVIDVYGYTKINNIQIGILYEFCDGSDLHTLIKAAKLENKEISLLEKWFFIKKCVEAVNHLHLKRVMHGDIRPDNFLVSKDRTKVKLFNFGTAKIDEYNDHRVSTTCGGSLRFFAPERHTAFIKEGIMYLTCEGDIFSLGLTIYEILAGERPYEGYREEGVAWKYSKKERPKLDPKKIPKELIKLYELCVEHDPKDRASAKELLEYMNSKEDRYKPVKIRGISNCNINTLLNVDMLVETKIVKGKEDKECDNCLSDENACYKTKCNHYLCEQCIMLNLKKLKKSVTETDVKEKVVQIKCTYGCKTVLPLNWLVGISKVSNENHIMNIIVDIEKKLFCPKPIQKKK